MEVAEKPPVPIEALNTAEQLSAVENFQLHGEGMTLDNNSAGIYEPEKIGIMSKFDTGETTTIVAEVAVGDSKFAVVRFDGAEGAITMLGGLDINENGESTLNKQWVSLTEGKPLVVGRNPRAKEGEDAVGIDHLNANTDPESRDMAVSANHLYMVLKDGQLELKDISSNGTAVVGKEAEVLAVEQVEDQVLDETQELEKDEASMPEEIIEQEANLSEMIGDFEATIGGKRGFGKVVEDMYSFSDSISQKARNIQKNEVGFEGAQEALRILQKRLMDYDTRSLNSPEERVKTRRMIDEVHGLLTVSFNKQKALHDDIAKNKEDGPFTETVKSVTEIVESEAKAVSADATEQESLEVKFTDVGRQLIESLGGLDNASEAISSQAVDSQKKAINEMLGRMNDVLASGRLHAGDLSWVSDVFKNMRTAIEQQQYGLENLATKSNNIPQIVDQLSKIVKENKGQVK